MTGTESNNFSYMGESIIYNLQDFEERFSELQSSLDNHLNQTTMGVRDIYLVRIGDIQHTCEANFNFYNFEDDATLSIRYFYEDEQLEKDAFVERIVNSNSYNFSANYSYILSENNRVQSVSLDFVVVPNV